eukprot:m.74418 g.74418  ORF g.74418 m.74418 type:complete len:50 (-) comp16158_c0_seq20:775-924(-)
MDIKNGTKYADVPWTRFDDAGNVVQDQGLYTIADGIVRFNLFSSKAVCR